MAYGFISVILKQAPQRTKNASQRALVAEKGDIFHSVAADFHL